MPLLPPLCTDSAGGFKPLVAVAVITTPPAAFILNWLARSVAKAAVVEPSAQMKETAPSVSSARRWGG